MSHSWHFLCLSLCKPNFTTIIFIQSNTTKLLYPHTYCNHLVRLSVRQTQSYLNSPNTQMHDTSLSWLGTATPNTQIHDISLSWLDTANTQIHDISLSYMHNILTQSSDTCTFYLLNHYTCTQYTYLQTRCINNILIQSPYVYIIYLLNHINIGIMLIQPYRYILYLPKHLMHTILHSKY